MQSMLISCCLVLNPPTITMVLFDIPFTSHNSQFFPRVRRGPSNFLPGLKQTDLNSTVSMTSGGACIMPETFQGHQKWGG